MKYEMTNLANTCKVHSIYKENRVQQKSEAALRNITLYKVVYECVLCSVYTCETEIQYLNFYEKYFGANIYKIPS